MTELETPATSVISSHGYQVTITVEQAQPPEDMEVVPFTSTQILGVRDKIVEDVLFSFLHDRSFKETKNDADNLQAVREAMLEEIDSLSESYQNQLQFNGQHENDKQALREVISEKDSHLDSAETIIIALARYGTELRREVIDHQEVTPTHVEDEQSGV